ncbi:hypothetical protein FSARC_6955 [Fusarium sarcochroum]|uniref:GPI anchored serine-rich protein n=1 Tax=Fusarium sarcochroum TaxID=1208366 RepID=A0A8H4X8V3_9HYPO|nr:hypothetical protein FSARC_6955 [Fusarium sarcochroum]
MHFTSIFIAAAGASVAAAQDYAAPLDTTTLTSTTTRVVTLTQCNPTVADCPLRTTTSTQVVVTTSTAQPVVPTTSTEEPEVPTTTSVYVPPTTSVYQPPVVNTTSHEVPTIITTPIISTTKKAPTAKTTFYPAGNTTTKAGPTAPVSPTTKLPVPGSNSDVPGKPEQSGNGAPSPSIVPTAAANGLVASSSFLGAAIMAAMVALY